MPVVHVNMYSGRPKEVKANMAKAITEAISKTANIPDSATTVIFHDIEKSDWASGGVLASDQQ